MMKRFVFLKLAMFGKEEEETDQGTRVVLLEFVSLLIPSPTK